MGTKATVLSQIMKDGLSTLAIKYQLVQMRYVYEFKLCNISTQCIRTNYVG